MSQFTSKFNSLNFGSFLTNKWSFLTNSDSKILFMALISNKNLFSTLKFKMAAVNIGSLQTNLLCGLIVTNKWSHKGLRKSIKLVYRGFEVWPIEW